MPRIEPQLSGAAVSRAAATLAPHGRFTRMFASRAAAPGEVYGLPGQGKSTTISVITVMTGSRMTWLNQ